MISRILTMIPGFGHSEVVIIYPDIWIEYDRLQKDEFIETGRVIFLNNDLNGTGVSEKTWITTTLPLCGNSLMKKSAWNIWATIWIPKLQNLRETIKSMGFKV